MHSGGSDQTTNILVYITTFHRALQKKRKNGRLKALQQLTYTTNYSSQTSKPSYHSIINLCTASIAAERLSGESMTMQLFLKDNLSSVFCFCFWTAFTKTTGETPKVRSDKRKRKRRKTNSNSNSNSCQKLPSVAISCQKLSSVAISCHHLPKVAASCHQLQKDAISYQKLHILAEVLKISKSGSGYTLAHYHYKSSCLS